MANAKIIEMKAQQVADIKEKIAKQKGEGAPAADAE